MAVQRSMEELNARIQALIKEKCTAIHPVVEWRFRKAVLEGMDNQPGDADDSARDGADRVREGLSAVRALGHPRLLDAAGPAIQADLLTQLGWPARWCAPAYDARPLPALARALYRIDKHIEQIQR